MVNLKRLKNNELANRYDVIYNKVSKHPLLLALGAEEYQRLWSSVSFRAMGLEIRFYSWPSKPRDDWALNADSRPGYDVTFEWSINNGGHYPAARGPSLRKVIAETIGGHPDKLQALAIQQILS